MPSPFRGMDPFLERPSLWPDVHNRLIAAASDLLVAQLRPRYFVRIEERVYVSDEVDDEIHEPRLEILDAERQGVVTLIEILSPANKVNGSRGRESYQQKRQDVLHSPGTFRGD